MASDPTKPWPLALLVPSTGQGEVYLNPGEFHFHSPAPDRPPPTRLRTLLGSCVSVILWHPQRRLAGMSHSILPNRKRIAGLPFDARYCDEAVMLFRRELTRAGAAPEEFHAYLVGGGQMYFTESSKFSIGDHNIEATRNHLEVAGFRLRAEHVGKDAYSKVEIDLATGAVTVTFANQRVVLAAS